MIHQRPIMGSLWNQCFRANQAISTATIYQLNSKKNSYKTFVCQSRNGSIRTILLVKLTRINGCNSTNSWLSKIWIKNLLKCFTASIKRYSSNFEASWHQSLPRAITIYSFFPTLWKEYKQPNLQILNHKEHIQLHRPVRIQTHRNDLFHKSIGINSTGKNWKSPIHIQVCECVCVINYDINQLWDALYK